MTSDPAEAPTGLTKANLHLAAILAGVGPLARILATRPWGVGLTSLCLFTSDNPVQILNAKDDDEPLHAAAYWDIYLPLDSHRFLYLPGQMHSTRRALMRDHRINLPGGLAIALNDCVVETAHRNLIWHPAHDPRSRIDMDTAVAIRRSRRDHGPSGNVVQYGPLKPGDSIERRWLEQHTWDQPVHGTSMERTGDSAVAAATGMLHRLEAAQDDYNNQN